MKTGFYMLRTTEKILLALQIMHFLFSMPVVYHPYPLYCHVLMRMLKLSVEERVVKSTTQLCSRVLQYYATVATECAGYVL